MDDDLGADALNWLGTQYKTILTPEDSAGGISVTDSVSPPMSGPPRHIHHDADETFVVLTGEVGFWLDGETHIRAAGESIFIPKGKPHTFLVLSDVPSRHLVILTPGGFEGFSKKWQTVSSVSRRICHRSKRVPRGSSLVYADRL